VPVVWNAVGVLATLPDWSAPLVAAAAASVAHLAVRHELGAARLLELAPGAVPRVVPDTAFGVGELLGDREAGRAIREAAGLNGRPYVVVQPTWAMHSVRDAVVAAVKDARARGLAVLELPIGPVHGDAPGVLDLPGTISLVGAWPAPVALAEVLADAEAVIAESLHAAIIAASQGVPVLRPATVPESMHSSTAWRASTRSTRGSSGARNRTCGSAACWRSSLRTGMPSLSRQARGVSQWRRRYA
jgi:lipopolysaccharide transport system ATP-binding protein